MALVITRKPGEVLVLTTESGERIEIISGSKHAVRLLVKAPQSVHIMRSELEGKAGAA